MNIYRLYQCLTEHEKRQLKTLIEKDYAVISTDMNVYDWINAVEPSIRLVNCLMKNFPNKKVSEISTKDLWKIPGVGMRTYNEFRKLIGEI